jgi:EAL domain-containing protein (putative c-di-GMP-specific phosphodiesterase class I)
MSYLQNFEIDKIKIDKRFVQGLDDGASSAAIVQAIINLGSNIGVSTTAEGVETEEQLASILERGCTQVQGYLFSRPLTPEDARLFLARNRADRAGEGQ